MADFDLTQTDAQVQSILNDAQDAMGAGAQTSLTTDYIMLKGTNGRYHKILKDSFTEAVRNTLAGLLMNNDKGTTISQIAAIASGDFGSVTPANLASVLGVGTQKYTNAIDDCNNLAAGLSSLTHGQVTQNIPQEFQGEDMNFGIICLGTDNLKFQLIGRFSRCFLRMYINSTWGDWIKLYWADSQTL